MIILLIATDFVLLFVWMLMLLFLCNSKIIYMYENTICNIIYNYNTPDESDDKSLFKAFDRLKLKINRRVWNLLDTRDEWRDCLPEAVVLICRYHSV